MFEVVSDCLVLRTEIITHNGRNVMVRVSATLTWGYVTQRQRANTLIACTRGTRPESLSETHDAPYTSSLLPLFDFWLWNSKGRYPCLALLQDPIGSQVGARAVTDETASFASTHF